MSTLFSVLIANYNGEKYLRECINSVISQTYKNWEIILVDDGSTDNSQSIYNDFSHDSKIKIYRRNENKGCTYTKAECIEYANGNLCGFLDVDDTLTEDAIEQMVVAHNDEQVSIVSSRYRIVNQDGVYIASNRLLSFPGGGYLEGRDYSPEHFVSFKKSYYLQTKGLDLIHKIGDDQELYLLLEEVGKWVVLDAELYNYRMNPNSISRKKTFDCYFWNMIVRYEACVRRGLDPELYALKDFNEALLEFAEHEIALREKQIRNSLPYKIGKTILKPISFLKSCFVKR